MTDRELLMLVSVLAGFLFLLLVIAIWRISKLQRENEKMKDENWDMKQKTEWQRKVIQETQTKFEEELRLRQLREREIEELLMKLEIASHGPVDFMEDPDEGFEEGSDGD